MRILFIVSTVIFWLAVAGFWLASYQRPPVQFAEVESAAEPGLRNFSLPEVAQHKLEKDCWMAIEGQVYDLTGYLPDHPSDPAIVLPWCGKEATQAWLTKTVGRPHSSRANKLLQQYLIGTLQQTP